MAAAAAPAIGARKIAPGPALALSLIAAATAYAVARPRRRRSYFVRLGADQCGAVVQALQACRCIPPGLFRCCAMRAPRGVGTPVGCRKVLAILLSAPAAACLMTPRICLFLPLLWSLFRSYRGRLKAPAFLLSFGRLQICVCCARFSVPLPRRNVGPWRPVPVKAGKIRPQVRRPRRVLFQTLWPCPVVRSTGRPLQLPAC